MHKDLKALVELFNLKIVKKVGRTTIIVKGKRGEDVHISMNIRNTLMATGQIPGVPTRILGEGSWIYRIDI